MYMYMAIHSYCSESSHTVVKAVIIVHTVDIVEHIHVYTSKMTNKPCTIGLEGGVGYSMYIQHVHVHVQRRLLRGRSPMGIL